LQRTSRAWLERISLIARFGRRCNPVKKACNRKQSWSIE
jgi:hypothetical protein